MSADAPVLSVSGLGLVLPQGQVLLHDVSLVVAPGEIVGVVGESGSGKTQLLLSLLGLAAPGAQVSGHLQFCGEPLDAERLRGDRITMLFQDPLTSLNPHLRLGVQLAEGLQARRGVRPAEARARAVAALAATGLADPATLLERYPHELSGGMRQRVLLAMAIMTDPSLLLADEPTTALDLTTQARVLDLLLALRDRTGMAILIVTHDLGVVARVADRLLVMREGRVVESGTTEDLLTSPSHSYTRSLLEAARRLEGFEALA